MSFELASRKAGPIDTEKVMGLMTRFAGIDVSLTHIDGVVRTDEVECRSRTPQSLE
jgi:hypothetical protein